MIDITDFQVEEGQAHTYMAIIDDEKLSIDLNPEVDLDQDGFIGIVQDAKANGYELYELMGQDRMPCIAFEGEPSIGSRFLQSILKRLYNVTGPILVLTHDESDGVCEPKVLGTGQILCMPSIQAKPEMMKEIGDIFVSLCRYRAIAYEPKPMAYMPLTWDVTAYKDGSEVDPAVALPPRAQDAPSSLILALTRYFRLPDTVGSISRVKMTKGQMTRAALVDSILMHSKEEIITDQEKAKQLVPMLSKDRSRDMTLFLGVGRCLHRIFKGSKGDMASSDGLDLWRSASIPEMQDACDEYWPAMETTSTYYRISTLQHWAKQDSPEAYKEWMATSIHAALEASVLSTGGDLDVAKVAYRKNPSLFVCAGQDNAKATFFMFNGTYYKPCGTFEVKKYLINDVIPEYEQFHRDLNKILDANVDQDTSFTQMMMDKITACKGIVKKLKGESYQMAITKELMLLYNLPGFHLVRDSNPNLTAFEDCVFDASLATSMGGDGEPESSQIGRGIRPGVPEDYCTCSTGYEWLEFWREVNGWRDEDGDVDPWSHPMVKEVLGHIEHIIRDPAKREFLRREYASLLHASNPRKRGIMIYGGTNNAKSALYAWISLALGPTLAPGFAGHLLCSPAPPPGSPTPELEPLRFARIMIQPEISDLMVLNEDLLKRITGCVDYLASRALYGEVIPFVPYAKPHGVGNSLPRINGNSAALCTRLYAVELDSRFLFKSSRDQAYQKIMHMSPEEQETYMQARGWYWADISFNDVIKRTFKAFMWIMMQDFIQYAVHDPAYSHRSPAYNVPMANPPKVIEDSTIKYFTENNLFLQFLKARVKNIPETPGMTTYALHGAYTSWFRETVSRRESPVSMEKFIYELSLMGLDPYNGVYRGLVLTNNFIA